ncbi:hypothetical protein GQ43DRAFT_351620, partial [Delitschia confertaspora ATCC 74209]
LAVSAAELEIANPIEPLPTEGIRGHGSRKGIGQTPTCVCGKEHRYAYCFILTTHDPRRPKGYQPPGDLVRKVEEARKGSKISARINTALEKWAASQPQSAGKLRIDD